MALRVTLLFCKIISLLFAFSSAIQQINPNQQLINDLDSAKLKIAELEAVIEKTIQRIDAKTLYLEEREKLIQDAGDQIRDLQSALSSVKVKLLWAALRKSNFDLHMLKDKASEAEDRVEVTASEVEKMSDIVTEQWIQVQHLEQMREFNARRHGKPNRCTFLKLFNDLRERHLPRAREMFNIHSRGRKFYLQSYLSHGLSHLRIFWTAITKYHHQFQGLIQHEMERNKITAALANREVVFFMASALITFPVLGAWMWLHSS